MMFTSDSYQWFRVALQGSPIMETLPHPINQAQFGSRWGLAPEYEIHKTYEQIGMQSPSGWPMFVSSSTLAQMLM